jgi:hypothetical protein
MTSSLYYASCLTICQGDPRGVVLCISRRLRIASRYYWCMHVQKSELINEAACPTPTNAFYLSQLISHLHISARPDLSHECQQLRRA